MMMVMRNMTFNMMMALLLDYHNHDYRDAYNNENDDLIIIMMLIMIAMKMVMIIETCDRTNPN